MLSSQRLWPRLCSRVVAFALISIAMGPSRVQVHAVGDAGLDPAASVRRDPVGLGGSPAAAIVFVQRLVAFQDWVHDAPCCLDASLAPEERVVPAQRVAQEAFVWLHLIARVAVFNQTDVFADHRFAGRLHSGGQCDGDIRTQPKADLVGDDPLPCESKERVTPAA